MSKKAKSSKMTLSWEELYRKGVESMQAVIITDAFDTKLHALNLENSHSLITVGGVEILKF